MWQLPLQKKRRGERERPFLTFSSERPVNLSRPLPCEVSKERLALQEAPSQYTAHEKERQARTVQREELKTSQAVTALLTHVAKGEQDSAEALLKRAPWLAFFKGTLIDLSGRSFENITSFQYAVWALDWNMWKMLLKYLPHEAAAWQFAEWEQKGTEYGKHFSLKPLIASLTNYAKRYTEQTREQLEEYWCTIVGGNQLLLPAHVVNEYCHLTRPFYLCPTFTEALGERSRQLEENQSTRDWFRGLTQEEGLGETFGVLRYNFKSAQACGINERIDGVLGAMEDAQALQQLWRVRQQQLEGLRIELCYVRDAQRLLDFHFPPALSSTVLEYMR